MTFETNTLNICDIPDVPLMITRESGCRETSEDAHAIAAYAQAIQANPLNIDAYVALAWLLATHPDERLRDGKRAVVLAQKALALESGPTHPSLMETLAAAHAEAGYFEEAVYWRTESLSAPPTPTA